MEKLTCTIGDCEAPARARQVCARHYGLLYRSGELPPRETKPRHSLSSVDEDNATALCQVCGPVRIRVRRDGKAHECWTLRSRPVKRDVRAQNLRQKYGISKGEYHSMVERQNGLCAICGTAPLKILVIDHDHGTGVVRDLLCNLCNSAIGFMKDDIGTARAAVDYLLRHSAA